MSLFPRPLLVLDTETTGIPAKHRFAEAVEFAAVLLDENGDEVDSYETLIRPAYDGPEIDGALAINQITRADLADASLASEILPELSDWLERHGNPHATAFNVDFDRVIVEKMNLRLRWANCIMRKAMPIMGAAGVLRPASPTHPAFDPDRPWLFPPLRQAAEFFGVEVIGEAHRALTDARTAAGVACAIRHRALAVAGAAWPASSPTPKSKSPATAAPSRPPP